MRKKCSISRISVLWKGMTRGEALAIEAWRVARLSALRAHK